MEKKNTKRIVLFDFNDYYDKSKIERLAENIINGVSKENEDIMNLQDVFFAMLIKNRIYYELLHTDNESDNQYMIDKCNYFYHIVVLLKEKLNNDFNSVKSNKDLFKFCKKYYDGNVSFSEFIYSYVNGDLDYIEIRESLEKEKNDLSIYKAMLEYEKKLKLKF